VVKNLKVFNNKALNKHKIHKLIHQLKAELGFSINALEITFVDSSKMLNLNSNYLKHNYSTDIVTFQYSKEKNNIDGEIIISYEDASRNAKRFNATDSEETIRLIIHGVLHLLGYDDQNPDDKKLMKAIENSLFTKFKILGCEI
jgi:rRNA maturation RNase YbeY